MFGFNGSQWQQMGSTITEPILRGTRLGTAVAMSEDGKRIAVGAPLVPDNGLSDVGMVMVFEWNGNTWVQVGSTLLGNGFKEESGAAVSLSWNGKILAVGAPECEAGKRGNYTLPKSNKWHTSVFTYKTQSSSD